MQATGALHAKCKERDVCKAGRGPGAKVRLDPGSSVLTELACDGLAVVLFQGLVEKNTKRHSRGPWLAPA